MKKILLESSQRERKKTAKFDTMTEKKTGGGHLTTQELRVIESPAYLDLALHLGISVFGNDPRNDSDSANIQPTTLLPNISQHGSYFL